MDLDIRHPLWQADSLCFSPPRRTNDRPIAINYTSFRPNSSPTSSVTFTAMEGQVAKQLPPRMTKKYLHPSCQGGRFVLLTTIEDQQPTYCHQLQLTNHNQQSQPAIEIVEQSSIYQLHQSAIEIATCNTGPSLCVPFFVRNKAGLTSVGAPCPYSLSSAHRPAGQLPERHRCGCWLEWRLLHYSGQRLHH